MARVTHVKRAQQRYHTKPVLNEDGTQKKVPVMNSRGEQKVTKRGTPVFLGLTERDLDRPKPLARCDAPGCGEDIQLGQPYKWIQPHGRSQMNRHESCPSWQVWEYSSSLSARIAQIQNGEPEGDTVDDVKSWLEEKASEIRELAEEKRESASNVEEGFGHETEMSAELNSTADDLDSWADELEQTELPDEPEPEPYDCPECGGTGHVDGGGVGEVDCLGCDGSGEVTPDELDEEDRDTWLDELRGAAIEALQNSPL